LPRLELVACGLAKLIDDGGLEVEVLSVRDEFS
jgi:hypothetical protein